MRDKQKTKKLNLYRKEQLTILLLLLCFVLSGFFLPKIKINTAPATTQISEESTEMVPENETGKIQEDIDNIETESEETESKETVADSTSETSSTKDSSSSTTTEKPSKNDSGSSATASKPSTNTSGSSTNKQPASSTEPEKVWVPPVYKTIHHEAVYQTVRVVVCNYCNASFSTVGEFQVHKDANGG